MEKNPDRAALAQAEIVLLEAWVADNPGSRAALRLARGFVDLHRLRDARQVLGKRLAINPGDIEARSLLADVLAGLGDDDGALAQLAEAAREISRHAGVFERLGAMLSAKGRQADADGARALAGALRAGVDALPAAEGLESATIASIYEAQGYPDQAREIYRKLLSRTPADQEISAKMAGAGTGKGGLVARLEKLKHAAELRASLGRAASE